MSIKVMCNENGVTLLELVITLALVIIFTGIVSLSLSSSDKRNLEEAASILQNDLRYIQRMSVAQGRRYRIIFDSTGSYYSVARRSTVALAPDERIKTVYFPEGVTLRSTNASNRTISYTPTGTTGDSCTIVLKNEKYEMKLTITVGSGRIEKKEISKEKST